MTPDFLTESEARELVEHHMAHEPPATPLQQILDAGEIPRLKGYTVVPGKVSDSIFGGKGYYKKKNGTKVEFENPALDSVIDTPLRLMARTLRISTHDKNRGEIPFKDQILALNHHFMRRMLMDIVGTSQYDVPGLTDSSVVVAAENLDSFMFENVLRVYASRTDTSTSLFRAYFVRNERVFSGYLLPEGLIPNGKLLFIMDTPSTKTDADKTIDPDYLFKKRICHPFEYREITNRNIEGFVAVAAFLKQRGMLLADTKTEMGKDKQGRIKSQDELYTMDSSRFWSCEDYGHQLDLFLRRDEKGLEAYIKETQPGIKEEEYTFNGGVVITPLSLSKEFARGMSKGSQGYTEQQRIEIAVRYIIGVQHLLNTRFEPDTRPHDERVISGLKTSVAELIKN